ncbi:Flavin-containing monooxygenase [Komagataella phaffii CBS 7435]|uniref:Flavin-containing monooxygenase, localized to the cytoplasmic face of the ER membrane n=2 Tax=Komagataella phaffii TaxID=460519 RepID=C4QX12_KOMPG|nr:Flavin-containing monooxygenase, localized to the cytoplasmic face of the ER membrane [Komagataella phaffii GS115]AOA61353.1 GQ67_02239T0 [Komagataella phaffii]CAH2446584.1 Flavin-containing monooxygenase [Komagataella phaffii CBS 7435]AOA65523.1 GQ68_02253T0 [Komagataella phaffii GS115]CAY67785.1 Flavin-containing monooxygenase, localized to the cytoplasmic face of the ER membrane [Komagataella phaffii GS115]CCA36870.1 Flavin-containing monooxygenase [Komagataella phaffii CBS 7435]
MAIKTIAIVGGGPSAVGAAKALLKENCFYKIHIYERRCTTGGLWNYSNQAPLFEIPNVNSNLQISPEKVDIIKEDGSGNQGPNHRFGAQYIWPSPVYDLLDTNVPKDIMEYKGFKWPDDTPLFPLREEVLCYLQAYSREVEPYIKFGHFVYDVSQLQNNQWKVSYRVVNESTGGGVTSDQRFESSEVYDAVILAVGNYDVPFLPDLPYLKTWNEKFPGSIIHAKSFRHPKQFVNESDILVVGNSASANDICYELATTLKCNIYKSKRSENNLPSPPNEGVIVVPEIARFIPESQEIEFIDQSRVGNVSMIIFATGYLKSFPFMKRINSSSKPLVKDNGTRVAGLYRQIISYEHPGLAVIGLPRFVLPTRLSETQGAWLARVFSGRINLPEKQTRAKWEENRLNVTGPGKAFHDLKFPCDVLYSHELNREIWKGGLDHGLIPISWNQDQTKIRGGIKEIKESYIKYKRERGKKATTIKQLEENAGLVLPPLEAGIFDFSFIAGEHAM